MNLELLKINQYSDSETHIVNNMKHYSTKIQIANLKSNISRNTIDECSVDGKIPPISTIKTNYKSFKYFNTGRPNSRADSELEDSIINNETDHKIPNDKLKKVTVLFSKRNLHKENKNNAKIVPLFKSNKIEEIKATLMPDPKMKHHFPKKLSLPNTIYKLKLKGNRTARIFGSYGINIEKESYLLKKSKNPNKSLIKKYCILKGNTFIWKKSKLSNIMQSCIQFDLYKNIKIQQTNENTMMFVFNNIK